MTPEEFVAQLDDFELRSLELFEGGAEPEELEELVLEIVPRLLHFGLVVTREEHGWITLELTDAGRAALVRRASEASGA